jgi:hypothetical protein
VFSTDADSKQAAVGVRVTKSNVDVARFADIVVLAVKVRRCRCRALACGGARVAGVRSTEARRRRHRRVTALAAVHCADRSGGNQGRAARGQARRQHCGRRLVRSG